MTPVRPLPVFVTINSLTSGMVGHFLYRDSVRLVWRLISSLTRSLNAQQNHNHNKRKNANCTRFACVAVPFRVCAIKDWINRSPRLITNHPKAPLSAPVLFCSGPRTDVRQLVPLQNNFSLTFPFLAINSLSCQEPTPRSSKSGSSRTVMGQGRRHAFISPLPLPRLCNH